MLANGLARWEADGNLERFEWIRAGGADTVTGTVRELTGADPRPLQDWLSESRASFTGDPLGQLRRGRAGQERAPTRSRSISCRLRPLVWD